MAICPLVASAGINLGVVVVCALLLKRDLDARDKQMARLGREEALAKLTLSLANGKRTRVGWVWGGWTGSSRHWPDGARSYTLLVGKRTSCTAHWTQGE